MLDEGLQPPAREPYRYLFCMACAPRNRERSVNFENFFAGKTEVPSNLALLAREMPDRCLIVVELDRPIVLTPETRLALPQMRSEARREGKECVSSWRSQWSPNN